MVVDIDKAVEDLKALMDSGPGWASERAGIVLDLAEQRKSDQISQSEYEELLEDVVRTDVLDDLADDLEMKNNLVTSVMAVKNILGAVI